MIKEGGRGKGVGGRRENVRGRERVGVERRAGWGGRKKGRLDEGWNGRGGRDGEEEGGDLLLMSLWI